MCVWPAGICKIVPPVLPSVPSGLVSLAISYLSEQQKLTAQTCVCCKQVLDKPEGSKLTFSTREQVVEQLTWENFDTARFWDSGK